MHIYNIYINLQDTGEEIERNICTYITKISRIYTDINTYINTTLIHTIYGIY